MWEKDYLPGLGINPPFCLTDLSWSFVLGDTADAEVLYLGVPLHSLKERHTEAPQTGLAYLESR